MEDENINFNQEIFKQQLIQNYKNPYNAKKLEKYDVKVNQKNVSCGDSFDLYLKIKKENNKILVDQISFLGEGCVISTASFSILLSYIKDKDLEFIKKFSQKDLFDLIGLKIAKSRENCATLSIKALKNAILKLEKKL